MCDPGPTGNPYRTPTQPSRVFNQLGNPLDPPIGGPPPPAPDDFEAPAIYCYWGDPYQDSNGNWLCPGGPQAPTGWQSQRRKNPYIEPPIVQPPVLVVDPPGPPYQEPGEAEGEIFGFPTSYIFLGVLGLGCGAVVYFGGTK